MKQSRLYYNSSYILLELVKVERFLISYDPSSKNHYLQSYNLKFS